MDNESGKLKRSLGLRHVVFLVWLLWHLEQCLIHMVLQRFKVME